MCCAAAAAAVNAGLWDAWVAGRGVQIDVSLAQRSNDADDDDVTFVVSYCMASKAGATSKCDATLTIHERDLPSTGGVASVPPELLPSKAKLQHCMKRANSCVDYSDDHASEL